MDDLNETFAGMGELSLVARASLLETPGAIRLLQAFAAMDDRYRKYTILCAENVVEVTAVKERRSGHLSLVRT